MMQKSILHLSLTNKSRFVLISLTMDSILGEATVYGRRQILRTMTEGFDLKDFYGATLARIKEQGGVKANIGMAALMWISHSERPLQLHELSHALAVEIGSTDLNPAKIPLVETLSSSCLGLVIVDEEASTVRLFHFTLHKYLHTYPDLFNSTHSIMARTCLTYLNFQTVRGISSTFSPSPQSAPFLNYSSLYWGVHARRQASAGVVSLALKHLEQLESHISTRILLVDLISKTGRYSHDIPISGSLAGFTGLHCASVFGIAEVTSILMDQPNCDLNGRDFLGVTPLIWAAICGQEKVAKLLLQRPTVNPDKPDGYFRRTALSWAARMGHEGIVRLLLGRVTAKADGTDGWWGKTPRVLNVARGRRYVNPNWLDKYGQTPILLATEEGHEGVVKLLLGRKDVKSDKPNSDGRTLLCCAARNGHEGVVRVLLERDDVSPDKPDRDGRTPLSWAAHNGHEGVVKILLERDDVSLDKPDNNHRTPLCSAAFNGHEGVVKILLERDDVSPNKPDNHGATPLYWATRNEHEGIVRTLLERQDVSPDKPDNDRRTPLWWAARNGHEGVVKMLLERKDVSPDKLDRDGQAPLWWAIRNRHAGVVALLQPRGQM